jgi:hypothetical protein
MRLTLALFGIDPDGPLNEPFPQLIIFYGLNIHYLFFLIGFIVRYQRHRYLGLNNINDPRPRTYKIKIALQGVMAFFTLLMAAEVSEDGSFEPLGLIYIVYSGLWGLGIFL